MQAVGPMRLRNNGNIMISSQQSREHAQWTVTLPITCPFVSDLGQQDTGLFGPTSLVFPYHHIFSQKNKKGRKTASPIYRNIHKLTLSRQLKNPPKIMARHPHFIRGSFQTNFFNFHQQQQVGAQEDQEVMQTQITLRELRDRPKPKKSKKLDRQIKECVKSRHGHWKRFEQVKYIQFIRKYYYIMRSSLLRYHYRIFTTMAEEIGSRNAVQCKSHHQKMLKKANYCIENLIFTESDLCSPIRVGEGLEGNHFESVKLGIKNVATNENVPYFIIQTGPKMLIVIDERFVANY